MTAQPAIPTWWTLVSVLLRKEGANATVIAANSALLPACIVYLGYMLTPADPEAQRHWTLGALVVGLGGTCLSQVALAVLVDRFLGPKRLLDALPIPGGVYVAAYLSYGLALAAIVLASGALFMVIAGLATPSWSTVPPLIMVGVVSGLALSSLGAVLARSAPDLSTADVIVSLAGLVLAVTSPVFYPLSALPAYLQPVAWLSPYTHIAVLAGDVVSGRGLETGHLVALLVFFGAMLALLAAQSRMRTAS